METLQKIARSSKKYVIDHKTSLCVSATAAIAIAIHLGVVARFNEIIEENDLTVLFYGNPED